MRVTVSFLKRWQSTRVIISGPMEARDRLQSAAYSGAMKKQPESDGANCAGTSPALLMTWNCPKTQTS